MDLFSCFKDKDVLITGLTGFKGTWLAELLIQLGARVYGISLESSHQSFHSKALNHNLRTNSVIADITDPSLPNLVQDISPHFVFHLAAEAIVSNAIAEPMSTFSTNVLGTLNLLSSIASLSQPCISVFITSDKCYENVEWCYGYRESDPLGGKDPYSASKACAEIAINSFYRTYLVDSIHKIATARAGNVIGGGDFSPNRLIPDYIRSIQSSSPFILRSPYSVRPWQHVLDPLVGYLILAESLVLNKLIGFHSFNFGPDSSDPLTVTEVVSEISRSLTNSCNLNSFSSSSDSLSEKESRLLTLNTDKARTYLDWKPLYTQLESIHFTAQWYDAFLSGSDVSAVTSYQVNDALSRHVL